MEIVSGKTAAFSRINHIKGKSYKNILYPSESSLKSQKPLLELSLNPESSTKNKPGIDQTNIDRQIERSFRVVPPYMKVKHMVIWGNKTYLRIRGNYFTKKRKTLRTDFVMCSKLNYYRSRGLDVPKFSRFHEELPVIVDGKTFSMLFRFDKESIRKPVKVTYTAKASEIDFVGKDLTFAIFRSHKREGIKDENSENTAFFENARTLEMIVQNQLGLVLAARIKIELRVDLGTNKEDQQERLVTEKTSSTSQNVLFSSWHTNAISSQGFTLFESTSPSHRIEIEECLEASKGKKHFVFPVLNMQEMVKPAVTKAGMIDKGDEVRGSPLHTISTIIGRGGIAKAVKYVSPRLYFKDSKSVSIVGLKVQAVTAPEDGDSKERNIDWSRLIASNELNQYDFVN